MQKDTVLRFKSLCTRAEIVACDDKTSDMRITKEVPGINPETKETDTFVVTTDEPLCSLVVPASCPRIKCYAEQTKTFIGCRLTGLIQSQQNESGFWIKLPCGMCSETKNLHELTRRFVYDE